VNGTKIQVRHADGSMGETLYRPNLDLAAEVRARFAEMEEDEPAEDMPNADDVFGTENPAPAEERPHRWQPAADAIEAPTPDPIVEGIAWSDSVTVLVGESAAGKTFAELDLAAHVSADLKWHGREVAHGSVVYVGFEGHVGLRLRALRDVLGHHLHNIYIIRATDPLCPIIDRDRLELPGRGEIEVARDLDEIVAHVRTAGLPPVRLVEVDTVRASLSGSEDSSESVSAYLRAVRRLMARVPGATFLLAHHAGWQDGETKRKRERGSSAFRGNVDGTVYLEADDYDQERGQARLTLTTVKVRDGETLPPLHLIRRRVEIPGLADRWGNPVTSCVIDSDRRSREDREAEQASATEAAQRAIDLQVLRVMHDYPTATSIRVLRAQVGLGEPVVGAAVGRIVRAGWAAPGRRNEPYQVLPEGYHVLGIATTPNDTERHPGVAPSNDTRHHPLRGVGVHANSGAVRSGDTTPEESTSEGDECR
jgi:hypothetical protein